MIRIYNLEETQWGFDIVGPHGHKWVCGNGEARTRATALAKAFERAFVEGQSEIINNEDLLLILTSLALVPATPSDSDLQRIALLRGKAQQLLRRIERLRFMLGRSDKRTGENSEES